MWKSENPNHTVCLEQIVKTPLLSRQALAFLGPNPIIRNAKKIKLDAVILFYDYK